jgi:hypothetical protein
VMTFSTPYFSLRTTPFLCQCPQNTWLHRPTESHRQKRQLQPTLLTHRFDSHPRFLSTRANVLHV